MLRNSPDGWMTDPRVGQPIGGYPNPGFHWLGSDVPWDLLHARRNLAAAARCLELIAGTISGMPWHVKRGRETLPTPSWIEDPQLARPDNRVTAIGDWDARLDPVAFRNQIVTSLLMHGNAYIFVPVRAADGTPLPPLFVLNPSDVDIRNGTYYVNNEALPSRTVIHVRGRGPFDREGRGVGVLDAEASSLGLMNLVESKLEKSVTAPVPAGVLEVQSGYALSREEALEIKQRWLEDHEGQYGIAVLNGTTTFHPLSWSNDSLQLLGFADYALKQVALAFGLSPSWVGAEDTSLTYSTVQMRALELRQFSLLTWARRIESVFDSELPKGTGLRIVLDGLERGSTGERYQAYQLATSMGLMTIDEVRELEGLGPL